MEKKHVPNHQSENHLLNHIKPHKTDLFIGQIAISVLPISKFRARPSPGQVRDQNGHAFKG